MRSLLLTLLATLLAGPAAAEPLVVVTTVPKLGSLAREVGGEHVRVTVLAKPGEDPHFVDPRPSFVRVLNRADALVLVGLELEKGWLPPLVRNARNERILLGTSGYIDAGTVIAPLSLPAPGTSRSAGDVHAHGNPHYLLDPIAGLRVARLLRERFSAIRPARTAAFAERYDDLARRLGEALFGASLARRYDVEKLALLQLLGRLEAFLDGQGRRGELGGWARDAGAWGARDAVADHDLWPYFARRFGLRIVGLLEPKPGVPPTTRHLSDLIERMRRDDTRVILAAPYYPPRHADFVARETGARIAHMAHEVGAYPETASYLSMVSYNVAAVTGALAVSP